MSNDSLILELSNKIDELRKEVAELKKKPSGIRVSWQDKVSESGIQLTGGNTTIPRFGTVCSAVAIPVGPNQIGTIFLVKRDGDNVVLPLEMGTFSFVE